MEPSQSSEDIIQELRDWAYITDEIQGKAILVLFSGSVFSKAADEIERLREELDIVHRDMAHVTETSTNIIRRLTEQLEEARRG